MAGNKTNSNSLTAIFVSKLNYKKSAFRTKILKHWCLPDDMNFIDGTHSTCEIQEMENKEVDIIGRSESGKIALIEVKANLNEDLQDSQKKGGQYENAAKNHENVKLIYVIPEGYYHLSDLPKEGDKVIIATWSEIFEVAKDFDNTGFMEQINYFVESSFYGNDSILNKDDVAMFLSPSIITRVESVRSKIIKLMDGFCTKNNKIIEFIGKEWNRGKENLGYWYNIIKGEKKIEAWIGIGEAKNIKTSFLIYFELKNINTTKLGKINEEYFSEKEGVNFPIIDENNTLPEFLFEETVEGQQKKFNELMKNNINRLLKILK